MVSASAQPQESGKTCACVGRVGYCRNTLVTFLSAYHHHTAFPKADNPAHPILLAPINVIFFTFSPSLQPVLSPWRTAYCFLSWLIYLHSFLLRNATCSPAPRPFGKTWDLCCFFSLLLQGRRRMGLLAKKGKIGSCMSLWKIATFSQGIGANLQSPPKEKGWKEMV